MGTAMHAFSQSEGPAPRIDPPLPAYATCRLLVEVNRLANLTALWFQVVPGCTTHTAVFAATRSPFQSPSCLPENSVHVTGAWPLRAGPSPAPPQVGSALPRQCLCRKCCECACPGHSPVPPSVTPRPPPRGRNTEQRQLLLSLSSTSVHLGVSPSRQHPAPASAHGPHPISRRPDRLRRHRAHPSPDRPRGSFPSPQEVGGLPRLCPADSAHLS